MDEVTDMAAGSVSVVVLYSFFLYDSIKRRLKPS